MAIWPFGRRRKRSRKVVDDELSSETSPREPLLQSRSFGHSALHQPPQSHGFIYGSVKATRRDSKRRKRNNITITATHEINHHDNTRLTDLCRRAGSSSVASFRFHRQPASIDTSLSKDFVLSSCHYMANNSQHNLARSLPTLHARRSTTEPTVPVRKSSKRKRSDRAREKEIKNLSSPVTDLRRPSTLPAALQWWESRLVTRNTKTEHGDVSQVCLSSELGRNSPFDSETCAYKISGFSALVPRPVLRYTKPPRYSFGARYTSRTSTSKEKRRVIPVEELTRITRIKDLADDMDAGALREMMERDRCRKEMKRQVEQEKLQRKLQSRADRQREQERRRNSFDTSQLATSGDGVDRLQAHEIGVAVTSPDPHYRRKSADTSYYSSWKQDPSKESLQQRSGSSPKHQNLPRVDSDFEVNCSRRSPPSNATQDTNMSGTSGRLSISPINRDTGDVDADTSQYSGDVNGSMSDIHRNFDLDKRNSDNAGKLSTSWTTFFRRGNTRLRLRTAERTKTPSEFSIPSRESFQRINQSQQQQQPQSSSLAPPATTQPIPVLDRSHLRPGFLRTQSKFKEHFTDPLKEFPMPPGRELQTSNIPHLVPAPASSSLTGDNPSGIAATNEPHTGVRGSRSAVVNPEQRDVKRSSGAGSPDTNAESILLAHSLASIDSEGSWLSGRLSRRLSHQPKNSGGGSAGSTREILDEYVEIESYGHRNHDSRLTVDEEDQFASSRSVRKPSSQALGLEMDHDICVDIDNDRVINIDIDNDTNSSVELIPLQSPALPCIEENIAKEHGTLHASLGRRPQLICPDTRPLSKDVIVNDDSFASVVIEEPSSISHSQSQSYSHSPSLPHSDSMDRSRAHSPTNDDNVDIDANGPFLRPDNLEIRRATSVDLGRSHVRHISAGSAKLLDLSRGALEVEGSSKRRSTGSIGVEGTGLRVGEGV
ncbi:hypothetical protein GX48_06069 [Paracoccidioides brasiliensis]|nr:hypothetical protein GX48_06069 [Paracoccidioides brasiliensis]